MRRHFAIVALAAALAATGVQAESEPEVQALIERQFEAFAHDDAAAAWDFAAPSIRDRFSDASAFLNMVKRAYPPVYRHRSAEFEVAAQNGDEIRQGVTFVDPDNEVWRAVYTLERQTDGSWKITGCQLRHAEEAAL